MNYCHSNFTTGYLYLLMNQQRQDAYLELIQQLLNCSSGKERAITNQDLLDAGLVQTTLRVANEQMTLGN